MWKHLAGYGKGVWGLLSKLNCPCLLSVEVMPCSAVFLRRVTSWVGTLIKDLENCPSDDLAFGEAHWLFKYRLLCAFFFSPSLQPTFSHSLDFEASHSPESGWHPLQIHYTLAASPLAQQAWGWHKLASCLYITTHHLPEVAGRALFFLLLGQLLLFIDVGQKFSTRGSQLLWGSDIR